jgi:hypothetical protein
MPPLFVFLFQQIASNYSTKCTASAPGNNSPNIEVWMLTLVQPIGLQTVEMARVRAWVGRAFASCIQLSDYEKDSKVAANVTPTRGSRGFARVSVQLVWLTLWQDMYNKSSRDISIAPFVFNGHQRTFFLASGDLSECESR